MFCVPVRDAALLGPFPGKEFYTGKTSGSLSIAQIPYSREVVVGKWDDWIVAGPNDRYELRAYAGDGSLRRIVRREATQRDGLYLIQTGIRLHGWICQIIWMPWRSVLTTRWCLKQTSWVFTRCWF